MKTTTTLIILLMLVSCVSADTTTTTLQITQQPYDSQGYRIPFGHFINQQMLRGLLSVYEIPFGGERTDTNPRNWFYFFLVMMLFIPFTINVGKMAVAVFLIDMILSIFWGYIPEPVYYIFALLNIYLIADALVYKLFAPAPKPG